MPDPRTLFEVAPSSTDDPQARIAPPTLADRIRRIADRDDLDPMDRLTLEKAADMVEHAMAIEEGQPARARTTDPNTSHEAAAQVIPGSSRAQVLAVFHDVLSPLTDEELCHRLPRMSMSGARTRRHELETRGLVQAVDAEGVTEAGNACRRYEITGTGSEAARRIRQGHPWKAAS